MNGSIAHKTGSDPRAFDSWYEEEEEGRQFQLEIEHAVGGRSTGGEPAGPAPTWSVHVTPLSPSFSLPSLLLRRLTLCVVGLCIFLYPLNLQEHPGPLARAV